MAATAMSTSAESTTQPLRVLFVCSRNRLRSPTAERVFAEWPGFETASVGLAPDADEACTAEWLIWADRVFVMEAAHRRKLARRWPIASRSVWISRTTTTTWTRP